MENEHTVAEIKEPSILLTINKTYQEGITEKELLATTCRAWVINKTEEEKRDYAKYALGVVDGKVVGVYSILSWHKDPYELNRWAFDGEIAPSSIRDKYIGKSVQHYREHSGLSPIIFLNC